MFFERHGNDQSTADDKGDGSGAGSDVDSTFGANLLMNPNKIVASASASSRASSIIVDAAKAASASPPPHHHRQLFSDDDDDVISVKSVKQHPPVVKKSRYSESERSDVSGHLQPPAYAAAPPAVRAVANITDDIDRKMELLYELDRMERKGVRLPKKLNMTHSLQEIKAEYDRVKEDRNIDNSIKFQREMLMTCVRVVEFLNTKFDPFDFQLQGWSNSIHDGITSYDDVFEEMYHKYKGKAQIAPEIKLLFMVGGSAVMFHMINAMVKSSTLPGIDQVLKANPDIVRQVTSAAMKMANGANNNNGAQSGSSGAGGGGGLIDSLMGMFGFNGVGGGGAARPPPPAPAAAAPSQPQPRHAATMRGPSPINQVLNDLKQNAFSNAHTIEVISTVSENDIGALSDITGSEATSMADLMNDSVKQSGKATRSKRANTASVRKTMVIP